MKHRRNVLERAKGFRFGRGNKEREARDALFHAGNYAFAHRRRKKGDFRRLWQIRMGATLKALGISYSVFIGKLNKKGFSINRKMMQEIAQTHPMAFNRIVEQVK
jgi:large subunit ribosomal protein L20